MRRISRFDIPGRSRVVTAAEKSIGGPVGPHCDLWGLCFVLIQASLPSPAPLLLAALRALIGGVALAAWISLRRWRQPVSRHRDAGLTARYPR